MSIKDNVLLVRDMKQKREASRDKVLTASMKLFCEQGYEKTTTRQIIQRAGVLNGSLYHAFGNKEGIFKEIMMEAIKSALSESEKQLEKNRNMVVAIAFPFAMELYAASMSKKVAELLHNAHESWFIMNGFIHIMYEWIQGQLYKFNIDYKIDNYERGALAIMGTLGSFIEEYHITDNNVYYKDNLRVVLIELCSIFGIQVFDIDKLVDEVSDCLESEKINIMGFLL